MIQGVFAVYDSKARCYLQPFFCATKEVAQRAFASAAADEGTQLNKFPTDFTLYQVATWNDDTGELVKLAEHLNLGLAAMYQGGGHATQ